MNWIISGLTLAFVFLAFVFICLYLVITSPDDYDDRRKSIKIALIGAVDRDAVLFITILLALVGLIMMIWGLASLKSDILIYY